MDGREAFALSCFLGEEPRLKHPIAPARHGRLTALVAGAAALIAIAAPAAAQADTQPGQVKVMTRNLYLGADLNRALDDTNTTDLAIDAQIILSTVQATDFPDRAKLLAKEIAKNKPDLVGLQEVALWRRDTIPNPSPPSGVPPLGDGPLTPATTVDYDFLALLMKQLKKQGSDYRVVRVQKEADVEVPAANACPSEPDGPVCDGRLTMRDAILARNGKKADVKTKFEDSSHYDRQLVIEDIAGTTLDISFNRGWQYTEANVRGTKFRFVNTHLESADPDGTIREDQASELTAPFPPSSPPGPATEQSAGMPVVAVGDYNTDNDTVSGVDQLGYQALLDGGLIEMSTGPTAPDAENSCCIGTETIDNSPPGALADFDHQVDHVFTTSPDVEPLSTKVVGKDPSEFNQFQLWPSDHGGLVTKLQFPSP
jgi:endonuclease/exonuclease/phosphatase family metal-dependent hydrolase